MADPAAPSQIAHRLGDLAGPDGKHGAVWDVEVVSEPFSLASEDVDDALTRLDEQARQHGWDVVVGVPLGSRVGDVAFHRIPASRLRHVVGGLVLTGASMLVAAF
jgi:hypothetical protein